MLFSVIAFAATLIGALAGLGGGVFLRPLLAFLSVGKELASFTSSTTVLTLCLTNLIAGTVFARNSGDDEDVSLKDIFQPYLILISAGSVIGGYLGASLIPAAAERIINAIYCVVLLLLVLLLVLRDKLPRCTIRKRVPSFLVGLFTGTMSGFFGIGGGPFQMSALLLLFGSEGRTATKQSLFITLCTTLAAIFRYIMNHYYDFSIAVYTIPAAVAGGIIGAAIIRRMKHSQVQWILITSIATIFCFSVANVWNTL